MQNFKSRSKSQFCNNECKFNEEESAVVIGSDIEVTDSTLNTKQNFGKFQNNDLRSNYTLSARNIEIEDIEIEVE